VTENKKKFGAQLNSKQYSDIGPDDAQWTVEQRTVTQYIVTDTLTGVEHGKN
jgi:hypothetical protein